MSAAASAIRLIGVLWLAATLVATAHAETLRVGKSIAESFAFIPLDIGVRAGIFKKYGIEVEIAGLGGGARLQQAMAAGSIDIGLGSGPEMSAIAKGSPVKAVAAMAGPPLLLAMLVRADSPLRTPDDIKGKRVAVTTVNSLSAWLATEFARQKGWGTDGIALAPLGTTATLMATLKTGQVDAIVVDIATCYRAEENHEGRILVRFGDLVKDFHIHVIFATDRLVAERPEALRAFLKGWFETIAFMRANKGEAVKTAMEVLDFNEGIAGRAYDELMPMYSDDGRFDPKALAVLGRSYVDLKVLPSEPDMRTLYTEAFLPAR